MLEKVVKETISDKIVQQIRSLIQSREMHPGDQLPSERELAEMLSVSRIAVREAMKAVSAMGLVEVRAGEGTFIKEVTSSELIDPLASVLMNARTIDEVLEVRSVLEVGLVGIAAERASQDDIQKLEEIMEQMKSDILQGKDHLEADFAFHNAVANISKNSIFIQIMDMIGGLIREGIRQTTMVGGSSIRAYDGHSLILEKISMHDVEGAKTAMAFHLKQGENDLLRAWSQMNEEG